MIIEKSIYSDCTSKVDVLNAVTYVEWKPVFEW